MSKIVETVNRTRATLNNLPPPPPPKPPSALPQAQANSNPPTVNQANGAGGSGRRISPTPEFSKLVSNPEYALWAASMCKLAYSSSTDVLNAVKALIGAEDMSIITLGPTAATPKGLRIVYPDSVIYVIQGTTNSLQKNIYQSSGGMEAQVFSKNGMTPTANASAMKGTKFWAGFYFSAFVRLGLPWASFIGRDIRNNYRGKRVYLMGHSLGAAICEVVANIASWYEDCTNGVVDLGSDEPPIPPYHDAIDAPWINLCGGFTFGAPRVVDFADRHYRWSASGARTMTGSDIDHTGVSFGRLTSKILTFNHPGDPIPTVPRSAGGAPWIYVMAGATVGARNPQNNTLNVRTLGDFEPEDFFKDYPSYRNLPTTVSEFKNRADLYHKATRYMSFLRGVMAKYGGFPDAWKALYDVCYDADDAFQDDSIE